MVASHPDIVCPSPDGGLPDTGAYMSLFEATTGVRPVRVWKAEQRNDTAQDRGIGLEASNALWLETSVYRHGNG